MANTKQSKKRAIQAEAHRQHNASLRSRLRTLVKNVLKAIASSSKTDAQAAFQKAVPVIDGMVNKGIIHKNKAARHKSRLSAKIKALVQA